MSVLLPAPFSPRTAWIVPFCTVRSTWSSAVNVPNVFTMPLICTA